MGAGVWRYGERSRGFAGTCGTFSEACFGIGTVWATERAGSGGRNLSSSASF